MAKLYFYYSAMNAGKSAVLLQSDHNYRERGMNTLLYTPQLDNRYGEGKSLLESVCKVQQRFLIAILIFSLMSKIHCGTICSLCTNR